MCQKFVVALALILTVTGIEAGRGNKKKFDLASCVTAETIQTAKREAADCRGDMGGASTGSTPSPADRKKNWEQSLTCIIKKASTLLASAGAASISDAITLLAKTNFTAEAQEPFSTATIACATSKNIKLDDLVKTDVKNDDWKPAMECLKMGLTKACKTKDSAEGPPGSDSSVEIDGGDEN